MWTIIIIVAVLSMFGRRKKVTCKRIAPNKKQTITKQDRLNRIGLINALDEQIKSTIDSAIDFERKSRVSNIRLSNIKKEIDNTPQKMRDSDKYKKLLRDMDKEQTNTVRYDLQAKKQYSNAEKLQLKSIEYKRKYAL